MNGEQQSHICMWMLGSSPFLLNGEGTFRLRRTQLKFILHLHHQGTEIACVKSWMPRVFYSLRDQWKTSTKTKILATLCSLNDSREEFLWLSCRVVYEVHLGLGLYYPSILIYMESLNVTLFGNRVFADVIRLRWVCTRLEWAPTPIWLMPLWEEGNLDTDTENRRGEYHLKTQRHTQERTPGSYGLPAIATG